MAMECRSELSFALPVEPPSLGGRRCAASDVFSSHLWCRERKLVVPACAAQLVTGVKFVSRERELVCVTSGNSYFGAHLIRKLLVRGYMVRATIQNQVNFEEMKELLREEEMKQLESVVVARMTDLDSLCEAFRGCHAVFHTSSFIDPHGISGYTERMAFLETEAAGNVIEACSKAAYARRCILTSSLLASIWKGNNHEHDLDESSWTDEDFCIENKLWFALAKTRAEKVAWRKAMETKVKLVTVCPALVMAPSFPHADTESSLPYLKGGQIMLRQGVLATEDVDKAAEAHVYVYEEMDYGACGRYLCFGRTITTPEEAVLLENRLKMQQGLLSAYESDEIPARLCKSKLTRLLFRTARRLSCKQR